MSSAPLCRNVVGDGAVRRADATRTRLVELIAQGRNNLQIATQLGLSAKTVRNHVTNIFAKLGVENRAQAIVLARNAGIGTRRP